MKGSCASLLYLILMTRLTPLVHLMNTWMMQEAKTQSDSIRSRLVAIICYITSMGS